MRQIIVVFNTYTNERLQSLCSCVWNESIYVSGHSDFQSSKKPILKRKTTAMQQDKTIHYRLHKDWRESAVIPTAVAKQLESLLSTAYAPYSNYPVSSIVIMQSGALVVGTNQENAAFPSGLCAERVAVLAAKSAYPNESILSVYIMTGESERLPAAPCGSCRQVLHEMEVRQDTPFDLFLLNKTADALAFSGVQDLLPFSFTLPK